MALYTNIKGPINYTTVGSPTIENGIASGFSENDYLQIDNSNIRDFKTFELRIKFKVISTNSSYIFSYNSNPISTNLIAGAVVRSTYFGVWLFKKQDNTYQGYNCSYNFSQNLNTEFIVKIFTNMNNVDIYLYNVNNTLLAENHYTDQNLIGCISSKIVLGKVNTSAYDGSIDLNETYININGNAWFGTSFSKVKLHSPTAIAYTKVGNVSITDDGVASGFTDKNDYLTLPEFNPGANKWKFTTKVKFNSLSSHMSLIDRNSSYRCFQITIRNTGKFRINISNDGSNKANEVDGSHTVSINTIYYLSFEYTGTNYVFKYSTDNVNWTTDITINNSNAIYSGATLSMGHSWYNGGSEKWNGDIYMNYTHLFVDDIDYDTWKINII